MKKEKIERIQRISEWMRYILLALLLAFLVIGYSNAQNTDDFGMWMTVGTEKKLNDRWNFGAGIELRTYSIHKHHVVNLGYLLDLKRSAGGLDKVLHVITVGYVYKM